MELTSNVKLEKIDKFMARVTDIADKLELNPREMSIALDDLKNIQIYAMKYLADETIPKDTEG